MKTFSLINQFLGDRIGSSTFVTGMLERTSSETKFSRTFFVRFFHSDLRWNAVFGVKKTYSQVCVSDLEQMNDYLNSVWIY